MPNGSQFVTETACGFCTHTRYWIPTYWTKCPRRLVFVNLHSISVQLFLFLKLNYNMTTNLFSSHIVSIPSEQWEREKWIFCPSNSLLEVFFYQSCLLFRFSKEIIYFFWLTDWWFFKLGFNFWLRSTIFGLKNFIIQILYFMFSYAFYNFMRWWELTSIVFFGEELRLFCITKFTLNKISWNVSPTHEVWDF